MTPMSSDSLMLLWQPGGCPEGCCRTCSLLCAGGEGGPPHPGSVRLHDSNDFGTTSQLKSPELFGILANCWVCFCWSIINPLFSPWPCEVFVHVMRPWFQVTHLKAHGCFAWDDSFNTPERLSATIWRMERAHAKVMNNMMMHVVHGFCHTM